MLNSLVRSASFLLLILSCTQGGDRFVIKKGVDDYGVSYSVQCQDSLSACDLKPGIKLTIYDKFTRDSLKAIPLHQPDSFSLCCSSYKSVMDTLNKYKLDFDRMKNEQPFAGVRQSVVSGAAIGVGGVLTQPGIDSLFTVSIGIQPQHSASILAFKDTTSLNVFINKLDSVYRVCCLDK